MCSCKYNHSNRSVDGYGSLDRSWARRARGSTGGIGHKKRPDSMSADFTGNALALSPLAAENPAIVESRYPAIASSTRTPDRKRCHRCH